MADHAGLARLLKAEAEAQQIVEQARAKRRDMIKRATDEANRDIDAYKKQRTQQFEEYKKDRMAGIDDFKGQLGRATQDAITDLQKASGQHREEVVKLLLETVTNVDIKIPNEKHSQK